MSRCQWKAKALSDREEDQSQRRAGVCHPLGPQAVAFGQVMRREGACCYMAGFDLLWASVDEFRIEAFEAAKVLFLGNFFDVLIKNSRWSVVCDTAVRLLPYPCYRVLISGKWFAKSWDRQQRVVIDAAQAEKLRFREEHGPIFLEKASQHHFGYRPADSYLEKHLPGILAENVAQ